MRYDISVGSDGIVAISLAGELDINTVPALETALATTMAARPQHIAIEASSLEFADSSAIARFVRWANIARHLEMTLPTRPRLAQSSDHAVIERHEPESCRVLHSTGTDGPGGGR